MKPPTPGGTTFRRFLVMAGAGGDSGITRGGGVIDLTELEAVRVIVHGKQRFFREGLASLLSSEPGVKVVATVVSGAELEHACADFEADVAVVDLADGSDDDLELPRQLEDRHPGLRCVLLCNDARL